MTGNPDHLCDWIFKVVCSQCHKCLFPDRSRSARAALSTEKEQDECCPVCLGLWQDDDAFSARMDQALRTASKPYYCTANNNKFSRCKDPPLISVPGDVVFRYHVAFSRIIQQRQDTSKPTAIFLQQLKHHLQVLLLNCIQRIERQPSEVPLSTSPNALYPPCVDEEEQGYLAVNVLLTLSCGVARPPPHYLPSSNTKRNKRKRFETQGGHPRTHLERRLQLLEKEAGKTCSGLWTTSQALDAIEKNVSKNNDNHDWFFHSNVSNDNNPTNGDNKEQNHAWNIHVALWRRPFWVQGTYTKARRDVSQSPFFVADEMTRTHQRLGVTSVEEQIVTPLTRVACGGIATQNNHPDDPKILFGKAKFHASGREDLDVRMLLPDPDVMGGIITSTEAGGPTKKKNVGGRPFCCEVVDSLWLPTPQDLQRVVDVINCTASPKLSASNDQQQQPLFPASPLYFGQNPLGVGIDPANFTFAPSEAFKSLQSETESKNKFYGCLCWSEDVLPPDDELVRRLTLRAKNGDDVPDQRHSPEKHQQSPSLFPLKIHQRTPIRVLHRRSNVVRIRHITSCPKIVRLDDHYFKLHISTDAGTYVKEFCHGDLGRTRPNVSILLGGTKVDILELDCEGIAMN